MAPNRIPKPLSCVALSRNASIVAAGESGPQPGVLVWDCSTLAFRCELKGHQFGVACVAFSPDGKHLVSVGFPRDGCICLWDWRNKVLAAKVKASPVSSHIASIDFSLDNKFIVTAGKDQLSVWKVTWSKGSCARMRSVSVTMQRSVDLSHHKESSFIAVTSPSWTNSSSVNHNQAGEQTSVTESSLIQATRCCVVVSHSGCIWDIKNVPCENMHDPALSCVAKGCSGGLSFATCSADGNIRLWDLALQSALSENSSSLAGDDSSNRAACLVSAGIFERDSVAKGISSSGFRSMAVSSDGKHLAAGDCLGNIYIFNLYTSDYIFIQGVHGAEILSLSFNLADKNDVASTEALESHHFLASGGRDGRIHLFDVDRNFTLFGSIDYHSSAVTAVKVAQSGREILSCGADGSLVLHSIDVSDMEFKISHLHMVATSGIIYDMAVDHSMDVAFTVGKDKKIHAFDIQSGKLIKWFKHDADVGAPVKVTTDGTRGYVACSYSDRSICMYDYLTGKMVAQAAGHSDLITGIVFLPDCKHLVSVGADGCIFVWKLPALLSSRTLLRTKEIFLHFPPESLNQPMTSNQIKSYLHPQKRHSKEAFVNGNPNEVPNKIFLQEGNHPENAGFRFSISRLPKWAQCKVIDDSLPVDIDSSSSKVGLQQDNASQCPSKDILEVGQQCFGTLSRCLSETDSSQVSPSPPETYSWNSRWLTIHTVCMDLIDSPETCDMEGLNMQGSATNNRPQDQVIETTHCNKRIKLSSLAPSINYPCSEGNFAHNEHVNIKDAPFEEYKDVDASGKDSQENEFFKLNFGDLSAQMKTDRRKSSTRNSYLSQFLVRRELLEGRKRSLCMCAQDSTSESPRKTKKTNSSLLEDQGKASPSSVRQIGIPEIDSVEVPDSSSSTEMPLNMKVTDVRDQEAHDDKVREVEIVRSCEEALHNLEGAVENALQSFNRLVTVDVGGEKSRRDTEVQLYAMAARRLPSIGRKIQAIAKLLQPSNNVQ
ncbi:UNVERIFIED_CONTAM: WD repeat-containing protein 62 [Sesamum radiatum]|uniref:WD repeat-containing protein 62 n=1 Tax=Sesamum radiatum TaxID=300843 RepID=A0AAW2R5A0_SESRA